MLLNWLELINYLYNSYPNYLKVKNIQKLKDTNSLDPFDESKSTQQPKNQYNNYYSIQYFLDTSLHWNKFVDQPK